MLTHLSLFSRSRRRAQKGFTLMEVMLSVGIGVLIIAGVVLLGQSVLATMKVNRSKQILTMVGGNVQTTFGQSSGTDAPYNGLANGTLAKLAFVPADLINTGKVYLPLGNGRTTQVEITAGAGTIAGSYFDITVTNTQTYCADLAALNFGSFALVDKTNPKNVGSAATEVGTINAHAAGANADNSALIISAISNCDNTGPAIVWHHA